MSAPQPAEVLAAYATEQRLADREILRVIRDAFKANNREIQRLARAGGEDVRLRRDQLLAIKRQLLETQEAIFTRTGKVIQARRVRAAARAIQVAGRYDSAAFALLGRSEAARAFSEGLEERELRTLDVAVARMTGSAVPLSARVYRTQAFTSGMLERRINSGLARGLSAEQMARELRDFVNPDTPGGTRYAALRLARTEINNAFHAMSIQAARLKPWVTKMQWHKSRSHVRRDECDELDGRLFDVDDVPSKPHPMCLCYVTPHIDMSEASDEAFLDALANGDLDSFLDQFGNRHGFSTTG